jgi:glycosyltransferase involved in cell wall biosynthesis
MKKLTIITINYNNASGLQKTMESVLSQTSQDFEYIVVDGDAPLNPPCLWRDKPEGGKQDRDVVERFIQNKEKVIDGFVRCTYLSPFGGVGGGFYSEPDSGIYNAMNKGIRMAKGEYLHFLNSGDWLVDEFVVERMLKELSSFEFRVSGSESGVEATPIDIFVGNKIMVRPDGKVRYGHNDKRPVTALTFYRGTIEHTSAYIRRAMFDVVGMYDETLRIVSDYKWYFDAVLNHNALVAFTDIYVSYFDSTGISSTNQQLDKAERRQVLEQMLPPAVLADYDTYSFDIDQMQRLKRYPLIYKLVWFAERILFKFDKWNAKYWGWKKIN